MREKEKENPVFWIFLVFLLQPFDHQKVSIF